MKSTKLIKSDTIIIVIIVVVVVVIQCTVLRIDFSGQSFRE